MGICWGKSDKIIYDIENIPLILRKDFYNNTDYNIRLKSEINKINFKHYTTRIAFDAILNQNNKSIAEGYITLSYMLANYIDIYNIIYIFYRVIPLDINTIKEQRDFLICLLVKKGILESNKINSENIILSMTNTYSNIDFKYLVYFLNQNITIDDIIFCPLNINNNYKDIIMKIII